MSANEEPLGLDDEDDGLNNMEGESEQGDEVHGYLGEESEEAAKKWWIDQSWEDKWRDVFKQLVSGKGRWDESGDSHIAVLEDYKRQALLDKNPSQGARPTVLHELAKDFGIGDFQDIPNETRLKVMRYLLQHVQQRATTEGYELDDPILEVAMRCDNLKFVQYLLDNCADSLPDLLDAHGVTGMNSLHYAFKIHIPEALKHGERVRKRLAKKKNLNLKTFLVLLRQFVLRAKQETVTARDKKDENTPIHYALSYELCRLESEYYREKIVRPLVTKGDMVFLKRQHGLQFNKLGHSPYLYYKHSEDDWRQEHTSDATVRMQGKAGTKPQQQDDAKRSKDSKVDSAPGGFRPGEEKKAVKELPGKGEIAHKDLTLVQDQTLLRKDKQSSAQRGTADRMLDSPQLLTASRGLADKYPSSPVITKGTDTQFPPRHNAAAALQAGASMQAKGPRSAGEGPASGTTAPAKLDPETAAENIRDYLKLHYIRTRADMEAKELLYGKIASDRNMYFDATHQQGKTAAQVVDLIGKLSKAGGFEDTLSYVNLPSLSHISDKAGGSAKPYNPNEGRQRSSHDSKDNPKLGRSSLVSVFDELAEKGICNILRLHVEDMDAPAHTDAAIERAIRGRDYFSLGTRRTSAIEIETWDWRKFDLSTDVILFAAPNAVHINLYWSGNWAVLNGWACPNGIPRLWRESDKKLKTVTLHAFPGLESHDRVQKMIDRFKAEIKDHTEDKVKTEAKIRSNGRMMGSKTDDDMGILNGGRSEGPPQHVWIDRMEEFRSALFSVHDILRSKGLTSPRIKVALIDDGIDLGSLDTYNNVVQATGLSYYPPYGKTERPWHQSTNGHGTIMANMIVRINPWVALDVMRIQDSMAYKPGAEGGMRTISAISAANAIDGARIRKANIISMSWTIKKLAKTKINGANSEKLETPEAMAINKLQLAIEKARADGILMFCSAADDIQVVGKDSLPFSAAPDYIFRIGAALPKGQRDPASEDVNSISYFFPGNQVADAWNPRSAKTVEYHDGSSVSTALAAGLASLIMYCTNVVRDYHEAMTKGENQNRRVLEKRELWAEKLKIQDNMRKAFDNIYQKEHEDKKFLPVWHTFGKATDKMKSVKGEKIIDELDDLVTQLCSNLEAE